MSRKTDEDTVALACAMDKVRQAVPGALRMTLQTSDQSYYGFVLEDVFYDDLMGGERSLAAVDGDKREALADEVYEDLCDLNWDGVVRENKAGEATVLLAESAEAQQD